MKVLSTRKLRELVAPDELEDILEILKKEKKITFYRINTATTLIEISKLAEISFLLADESKAPTNPHPYVHNKKQKK